jgi:hypothetical protein
MTLEISKHTFGLSSELEGRVSCAQDLMADFNRTQMTQELHSTFEVSSCLRDNLIRSLLAESHSRTSDAMLTKDWAWETREN